MIEKGNGTENIYAAYNSHSKMTASSAVYD